MRRLAWRGGAVDAAIVVSLIALLDPIEEPLVPPVVEPMLVLGIEPMLLLDEPAVAPVFPGVPVSPIGVFWVLCWPAPMGALLMAGLGGLP